MNSENVGTWHGIIISPTQHVQKSREGHGEYWTHLVYKLDNLFRSIRVSGENSTVTRALQCFLNLFELQTFLRSVGTIQSEVINFQHFLTSFAIFQSFTYLFRELNVREIENHYKMNSEKVETWHGIIISPTQHVQKSREGYGKNWTHFVYKLDNLFRSIRVSDENSSVTRALQCFLNLFELWTSFVFSMQHSKRRHQFPTRSNIICSFFSHLPNCLES